MEYKYGDLLICIDPLGSANELYLGMICKFSHYKNDYAHVYRPGFPGRTTYYFRRRFKKVNDSKLLQAYYKGLGGE